MSVFLCPIDDINNDYPEIISVNALHFNEAQDKIEEKIRNIKEIDKSISWEDFRKKASIVDIYVGEIYDKEEF